MALGLAVLAPEFEEQGVVERLVVVSALIAGPAGIPWAFSNLVHRTSTAVAGKAIYRRLSTTDLVELRLLPTDTNATATWLHARGWPHNDSIVAALITRIRE